MPKLRLRSIVRAALRRPMVMVLPALLYFGVPGSAAAQATPPSVGVRVAEMREIARSYEFIGRISAIETVQLRARVEGYLDKVLFKEGQDLKAGDPLYQIEKSTYQAAVDQAKADVAAAKAIVSNVTLQYDRSVELARSRNAPQAMVDQNKAAMDSANAKVAQAEAALQLAEINLGYTDIRAPIDGRIGRTAYTQGNLVNAQSDVLATIVSQDPIYAVFPVSMRQLEDIRDDRRQEDGRMIEIDIRVRLSNGKEYQHPGVWDFTDVQVNQQTDTLTMRATLPNPERQLVDGQFVTVVVRERKGQPRLIVPQAALQLDQAGAYVLIVNPENKVEMQRIRTGAKEAAEIVVSEGLKQGDRVIVNGIQNIRVGQTVTPTLVAPAKGA